MKFIRLYRLDAFGVESNGSQGLFMTALQRGLKSENTDAPISCKLVYRESRGDKIQRIKSNLAIVLQSGNFLIRRDYEKVYPQFMDQFEYFPKGAHDDAPDVTNMAIMAIQKMRSKRL